MTARDNFMFLKKERQSFVNNNISQAKNDNQYSNLNLNQSSKSSSLFPVQSFSKSYNNKQYDYTVSGIYGGIEKSWKTASQTVLCSKLTNLEEKEAKKRWKKDGSLNLNSILSNQIFAYENCVEAVDLFCHKNNEGLEKEKLGFVPHHKSVNQIFAASNFIIQNPFEFPRQQNNEVPAPEVSQFKASQRLLGPNESLHNGQPDTNLSEDEQIRRCGIKLSEQKVKEILDLFEPFARRKSKVEGAPKVGEIVHGYKVRGYLGSGGYGSVCLVSKFDLFFAMKVMAVTEDETPSRKEFTQLQKCLLMDEMHENLLTACEYMSWRNGDKVLQILIMKLVGPDFQMMKALEKFDIKQGMKMMQAALKAMIVLHARKWVHHDIKLSNFAVNVLDDDIVFVIDFGMVKLTPEKEMTGIEFQGTRSYGSRRALEGYSQTFRDDAESWFNCVLEIYLGVLPWKGAMDQLKSMQEFYQNPVPNLPIHLLKIMKHISALQFNQNVHFKFLHNCLQDLIDEKDGLEVAKYIYMDKKIQNGTKIFSYRGKQKEYLKFTCKQASCSCYLFVESDAYEKASDGEEALILDFYQCSVCKT